jgi:hypothetical protein
MEKAFSPSKLDPLGQYLLELAGDWSVCVVLGKSFKKKVSLFHFLQNGQKCWISHSASPNGVKKACSPGKLDPLGHYLEELDGYWSVYVVLVKSFQKKVSLFHFLQNGQKCWISHGASPNCMDKAFSPGKLDPLGHYLKVLAGDWSVCVVLGKSFQKKVSLFHFLQNGQKGWISHGPSPNRMDKAFSPGKFDPLGHYLTELARYRSW